MKVKKTPPNQPKLKLKLHRETVRSLETSDLAPVVAGATSFCKSGVTCCNTACGW